MKTVRQLKEDMGFNTSLAEMMDVLKSIAISEFRALSKNQGRFTKFMEGFEGFFHLIDFSKVEHPFAKEEGQLAIIIVTSNEGFMGGLNMRVINDALSVEGADKANLIVIGEQGAAYLHGLGRKFLASFPGVGKDECYSMAAKIKDYIIKEGRAGRFGRLMLFYPRPVSFMVQRVEQIKILPCNQLFEISVDRKKKESKDGEKKKDAEDEVIVESSVNEIIEYLVETWIIQKLYEVFEDSKLAEFSARTVHLEESHQTLLEQGKEIRGEYFRSYHEFIDAGMRDIFSAQIVRKKIKRKQREGALL